jgi:hypothetical protein
VGVVAGAVGGATWVASQRFQSSQEAGIERIQVDRTYAEKLKGTPGKQLDKKED